MNQQPQHEHRQVAEWLAASQFCMAFTGAGISTESGIPDFRSPGGIWSQSQPVMFHDFVADPEARREYWRQKAIAHRDFADSRPNAGHRVLADWETSGRTNGVITQNIDGLHQMAGSQQVIELHGTAREVSCLDCHARSDADPWVAKFLEDGQTPSCPDCSGPLKHATISFGQSLDQATLERAFELTKQCDLFLVMGSSLVVEPAASLPFLAVQNGARLVIINREPTEKDRFANLVIAGGIGETLEHIDHVLSS